MDAKTSSARMQSTPATPWRLLALLMAMTAIGPATLNILVPAMPGLVTRLGSDTGTVQLTLSLYLVSLAAAQLLFGPLSDRFGRRPVILLALAGLGFEALATSSGAFAGTLGRGVWAHESFRRRATAKTRDARSTRRTEPQTLGRERRRSSAPHSIRRFGWQAIPDPICRWGLAA